MINTLEKMANTLMFAKIHCTSKEVLLGRKIKRNNVDGHIQFLEQIPTIDIFYHFGGKIHI